MSFKSPVTGGPPLASDVAQFAQAFIGAADVGSLSFCAAQSTPAAPTGTASATSGNLNGAYYWKTVLITGFLQSDGSFFVSGFAPSAASAQATVSSKQANITSIATGAAGTIGRAIYRTAAGGAAGTEKYVGVIWDNTTTTFTDNIADASLGSGMPSLITTLTISSMTSGNSTVTVTSTTGLSAGQKIFGTGVVYGSTVSSVTDSTHFVMSSAATVTQSSGYITVYPSTGAAFGAAIPANVPTSNTTGTTFNLPTYLPLSGGTMTGDIFFGYDTSPNTRGISFGNASGWRFPFKSNGSTVLRIGDNGQLYKGADDSIPYWHSGSLPVPANVATGTITTGAGIGSGYAVYANVGFQPKVVCLIRSNYTTIITSLNVWADGWLDNSSIYDAYEELTSTGFGVYPNAANAENMTLRYLAIG